MPSGLAAPPQGLPARLGAHPVAALIRRSVIVCFPNTVSQLLCNLQTLTEQRDLAALATVAGRRGAPAGAALQGRTPPPSSYL